MTRVIAQLIDIHRWLARDRDTPMPERAHRDRAIGRALSVSDDYGRVAAWWRAVAPDGAGQGDRIERLRRLALLALCLAGTAAGAGVTGLALAYDGSHPVNLFTLLGVVVAVPLLLLVLSLMLMPAILKPVRDWVSGLSVGRWVSTWLDRVARVDLFAAAGGPAGRFSRWQIFLSGQWLAVGFFAGALITAWLRIAFTDLAFGWSTTLDVDTARVGAFFAAVAAPWSAWLPAATPDAALVEASRYFRLETAPAGRADVARLGDWWPFVLMCITVYGLLPRLVLLAVAWWRGAAAARALLVHHPEVTALIDRLGAPELTFEHDAGVDQPETGGTGTAPIPEPAPVDATSLVIVWNEALPPEAARAWLQARYGFAPAAVRPVNVAQDDAVQRETIADRNGAEQPRRVVVFTKGWEPPLLEFCDFLVLARTTFGERVSLMVVPVAADGDTVDPGDRRIWAKTLGRLRDPRLYVAEATGSGAVT